MIEKNRAPRFLARSEILLVLSTHRYDDASRRRGKEKEKERREKRKGEKVEKNRLIRPIVRSVGAPGPGRLINGHVRLINGVSTTNHGEAAATGINTNYTRVAGRAPEAAKGLRGVP